MNTTNFTIVTIPEHFIIPNRNSAPLNNNFLSSSPRFLLLSPSGLYNVPK